MANRLYTVSLLWNDAKWQPEKVDAGLSDIGDWVRFNAFTWFVWTGKSKEEIFKSIAESTGGGFEGVIMAVQPESAVGFAKTWIWDWLNDKMQKQFHGKN